MKEISKVRAYKKKSIRSILSERHILKYLHHNFITNLYFSFQDNENLYLILDYFPGGDLRFYLNKNVQFKENEIKFFISNIIIGLKYLHQNNILHRDIKPENLIFDEKGYLNLADFGISKKIKKNKPIKDKSGTPGYLSPEILSKKTQTFICDYFTVGIVLYELIFLKRPFNGRNNQEIADNILHKNIKLKKNKLPSLFINSSSANDLIDFINGLLKRKAEERLGAKGIKQLIEHPWLNGTDWDTIETKLCKEEDIPFVPNPGDNFDYLKINDKIKKNDEKYNSYLKLINNSTIFNSFYFNSFSPNERKILSSKYLQYKDIGDQNENNSRIIHSETLNSKKDVFKKSMNDTRNDSEGSSEYTLSEYVLDEEDFDFNGKRKISGEIKQKIKTKRFNFSPKKVNDKYNMMKNRNSIF